MKENKRKVRNRINPEFIIFLGYNNYYYRMRREDGGYENQQINEVDWIFT